MLASVLGLLALLTYGLVAKAPDATIDDALARGEATKAPSFALEVLQPPPRDAGPLPRVAERAFRDGRVSLDELRGVPLALNFWASWCEPCRAEARTLERGWQRFRRAGAIVLGLNMQDVSDDARTFLRANRVSYPNVREGDDQTARSFGATGLPETYFIDARGDVVGHVIGQISAAQLTTGMEAATTGRPGAAASGGDRRETRQ